MNSAPGNAEDMVSPRGSWRAACLRSSNAEHAWRLACRTGAAQSAALGAC
jgi:hypothetical protein